MEFWRPINGRVSGPCGVSMHKNQAQATRRYRENQVKRGNRSVTVQCPVDRVEELKALVADWRNREHQNKDKNE